MTIETFLPLLIFFWRRWPTALAPVICFLPLLALQVGYARLDQR